MGKQDFFNWAQSANPPDVTLAMYQFFVEGEDKYQVTFGNGEKYGTMSLRYTVASIDVNLLLITHPGSVYPPFANFQKTPPFHEESMRLEVLDRYNSINGIELPKETIYRKWPRPGIRLENLLLPNATKQILKIIDWQVERINFAIGNGLLH